METVKLIRIEDNDVKRLPLKYYMLGGVFIYLFFSLDVELYYSVYSTTIIGNNIHQYNKLQYND